MTACDSKQQKRWALGVFFTLSFASLIILCVYWTQYVRAIDCSSSMLPGECNMACTASQASPLGTVQCAYCPSNSPGSNQQNCAYSAALGQVVSQAAICTILTAGAPTGIEQCNLCVYGSTTPPAGGTACSSLQGSTTLQNALGAQIGLGVGIAFTIFFFITAVACITVMCFGCKREEIQSPGGMVVKAVTGVPGQVYTLTMGVTAPFEGEKRVAVQPPNPYSSS